MLGHNGSSRSAVAMTAPVAATVIVQCQRTIVLEGGRSQLECIINRNKATRCEGVPLYTLTLSRLRLPMVATVSMVMAVVAFLHAAS
jgi:hypothetical protein